MSVYLPHPRCARDSRPLICVTKIFRVEMVAIAVLTNSYGALFKSWIFYQVDAERMFTQVSWVREVVTMSQCKSKKLLCTRPWGYGEVTSDTS